MGVDVDQHSLKYLRYIHFTVHGFCLKKVLLKFMAKFFFVILVEYTRAGKSKLFFVFHT